MASATPSNLDKMLTTLFPDRAADHGYEQSRLLSLIRKDTKFYGDDKKTVINIAPTAGGAAEFATAQGNKQPTQQVRFTVEHKLEYQLFSISGPLLRRAKGRGAIVDIYQNQMKNALYAFWRSIASGLWGNGGGSRGVIGSVTGNDTIVLNTKADISRFEKGMYVQLSDEDGTASSPVAMRNSGAQARITEIDHQSDVATITFDSNVSTIWPDYATGDYIFRAGDYAQKFTGILGWNPISAPTTSDSFMGVDRTVSVSRLSGYRVTGSGGAKEEVLIDAAAEAKFQGIHATHLFANPLDIKGLFKTQSGNVIIDVGTDMPTVSFKGVQLATPMGMVTVVPETDVPKGYAWLIDPSNYILRSAGELPTVLDDGGIIEHNDDAHEHRLGCDLQLDCDDPGQAVIITW